MRDGGQRALRSLAVGLLAVAAALLVARPLLASWVGRRLDATLPVGLRADVGRVEICLHCGGYRVHDLTLRTVDPRDEEPLLRAESVQVGLAWSRLLAGAWRARVTLWGPRLRLRVAGEAGRDVALPRLPWARVAAALHPAPVDVVRWLGGALAIEGRSGAVPVVWTLDGVEGEAHGLASGPAGEVVLDTRGRALGRGRFRARATLAPGAPGFRLRAQLARLPLRRLAGWSRGTLGLEPAAGTFGIRVEAHGRGNRWEGEVRCRLRGLDLETLHAGKRDGPARALYALARATRPGPAALRGELPLELRFPVRTAPAAHAEPRAWRALGRLVEAVLRAPFREPAAGLRALVGKALEARPLPAHAPRIANVG